jgi:hypothetical protein
MNNTQRKKKQCTKAHTKQDDKSFKMNALKKTCRIRNHTKNKIERKQMNNTQRQKKE